MRTQRQRPGSLIQHIRLTALQANGAMQGGVKTSL